MRGLLALLGGKLLSTIRSIERERILMCALALLLSSVTVTVAQNNPIKVGDNVQVSTANSSLIHEQPVVDVDPDNPQHLIACSHMFTSEPDVQIRGIVYVSFDGGRSWVKSLQAEGEGLHPWCAFGHGGLAYVTTLGRSACHPKTC